MKKLKNILLRYEDGNSRKVSWQDLDFSLQAAFADSGFCDLPSDISSAKNYLLLEWKDGWREVLAVNSNIAEVIRYYVIRRIEDRGRLALDVGGAYPELYVIKRLPTELDRLLVFNGTSVKLYGLQSELEGYEGQFEAGGKREYRKYDRDDSFFQNTVSQSPETMLEIENIVTKALKDDGFKPEELLTIEQEQRFNEYNNVAKSINLKGFKRQGEVYGFIELILKDVITRKGRGIKL